jgi:predicted TIM-barrel fold metal-dependent hydrolase
MDDPHFRHGLKRLPAHTLTFEAWIYHPQIATLIEVARECPETKIVLNHFGGPLGVGPYKRNEVFPAWRVAIKALSSCPNVYVKLGGLAMIVNAFDFHAEPLPPSSGEMAAAWRPYVEACMEDFGANRCMFESNFPVDRRVQLPGAVQRVQALGLRRFGLGKGRPLRRHRVPLLPARGLAPRVATQSTVLMPASA